MSVPGWSGAGYIILDPDTGSGAYKIAGGSNGGHLDLANVVFHISASMHLNWDQGIAKLSPIFTGIAKFLGVAAFINTAFLLAEHCNPVIAGAIAAMLYAFNSMVSSLMLGIIISNPWSAFIFAIAFSVIMAVIMNLINQMVTDVASFMCRHAFLNSRGGKNELEYERIV